MPRQQLVLGAIFDDIERDAVAGRLVLLQAVALHRMLLEVFSDVLVKIVYECGEFRTDWGGELRLYNVGEAATSRYMT